MSLYKGFSNQNRSGCLAVLGLLLWVLVPSLGQAATVDIRSVGYGSTAPLAQGSASSTLTINGAAAFSTNLPLNIGVGDCLIYDSNEDNALDKLAFIVARLSSNTFEICDINGEDVPSLSNATRYWRIHRAYISLGDAAQGLENPGMSDFTGWNFDTWSSNHALARNWYIACYADAPNTNTADFSSWNTAIGKDLVIMVPHDISGITPEVGVSQRHNGAWKNDAFTLVVSPGPEGLKLPQFSQVIGVQFYNLSGTSNSTAIFCYYNLVTSDVRISKCIFRGQPSTTTSGLLRGLRLSVPGTGSARIWNNVFYDYRANGEGHAGISLFSSVTGYKAYCFNNTLVNCMWGIDVQNVTTTVKNCLVMDSDAGCAFNGNFAAGSTNNLSNDTGIPPGANPRLGNAQFADPAAGDFHLTALDVNACNRGIDPIEAELGFSDDIDGQTRPYALWDIGADELAMQPTFTPTPTCTASPTVTWGASATPTYTLTPVPAPVGEPALEIAYPNPAKGDMVTFTCRPGPGEPVTVRVYSTAYREIWTCTRQGVPNQVNRMEWNINGIPPGIYVYRIETGSRKSPFKKLAIIQ